MHTLELFLSLEGVSQVVLVIGEEYRAQFDYLTAGTRRCSPSRTLGRKRQDSVFNGLSGTAEDASVVCIHDAAWPLVTRDEIYNVLRDGIEHGAAVLECR